MTQNYYIYLIEFNKCQHRQAQAFALLREKFTRNNFFLHSSVIMDTPSSSKDVK